MDATTQAIVRFACKKHHELVFYRRMDPIRAADAVVADLAEAEREGTVPELLGIEPPPTAEPMMPRSPFGG